MKAMELAVAQGDGWRKIPIALIDPGQPILSERKRLYLSYPTTTLNGTPRTVPIHSLIRYSSGVARASAGLRPWTPFVP